jgi:hypothetical protein
VDSERIIELYREGHSQKATAAIVGCSRTAVDRALREAGIVRRRGYMPRLDHEEIRRRSETGQTLALIGQAIGASSTGVRLAMVGAGIPRRPVGRNPMLDVEEIRRRRQGGRERRGDRTGHRCERDWRQEGRCAVRDPTWAIGLTAG